MENEKIQVEVIAKDYSTLSLVLGILSIVLICCTGFITFWFGLAATILGKKTMNGDPKQKKGRSGFICGIIGMAISVIGAIFWVVYIFFVVGIESGYEDSFLNPDYSSDYNYEETYTPPYYSEKVTYKNFIKLELGMPLKKVQETFGKGLKTGDGIFEWENEEGGLLIIKIDSRDRVEYKCQALLEMPVNTAITNEVKGKISMGMSLEEVEAMLGKGILISHSATHEHYIWDVADKYLFIDIENNKVEKIDSD